MHSDAEEESPKKICDVSGKLSRAIDELRYELGIVDDKICSLLEVNEAIQASLKDVLSFSVHSKVPLWLIRFIRDSLKCRICLTTPIKPPVIMSKCCKNILGCEECVNSWYSGEDALTKTCPSCRAERGYSETMLLRGLDTFLVEAKTIFESEQARSSSSVTV